MNLYIIRHAIAVEAGTPGFEEDHLRPLTDKGRRKMQKIAKGLRALEVGLDVILTSPYQRALETARILRKTFKLDKEALIETEHLAPVGSGEQLIGRIIEKFSSMESIALVGHEPSLGILVSMLISGDPHLSFALKKGGVCRLSVDTLQYGHCATLDWLLSPSQLVELAE